MLDPTLCNLGLLHARERVVADVRTRGEIAGVPAIELAILLERVVGPGSKEVWVNASPDAVVPGEPMLGHRVYPGGRARVGEPHQLCDHSRRAHQADLGTPCKAAT